MTLEMFFRKRPPGRKIFGTGREFAEAGAVLAANQGLYNGVLCVGLVWSLSQGACALQLKVYSPACAVLAGLSGALTASRSVLWVQALPGVVALSLVLVYLS